MAYRIRFVAELFAAFKDLSLKKIFVLNFDIF